MPASWAQLLHRRVDVDKLLQSTTVNRWYSTRKETNKKNAIYRFATYLRWREARGLPVDPDQWIEDCLSGTNRTLVTHLQNIMDWCEGDSLDGCTDETRRKYYHVARSFYLKNHVMLPKATLRPVRGDQSVPVQMTATKFLEMASKVVNLSGLTVRDRAVIMVMLQSGMDASTLTRCFNYVGFSQLSQWFGTEAWQRWDVESKVPVQIHLVRPKTDYIYYSFLHRDAISCLKDYLNFRLSSFGEIKIRRSSDPRRLDTSDPIFLTDEGKPIDPYYVSVIFKRAGIRAGVNIVPEEKMERYKGSKRRYPFHSHEVRDTLVTLGRRAGVDMAVVNFFVGHDIDHYGYDKSPFDDPEHFRGQYARLSPFLNIISGKEVALKEQYDRSLAEQLTARDKELAEIKTTQKAILAALNTPEGRRLVGRGAKLDAELLGLKKEELVDGSG